MEVFLLAGKRLFAVWLRVLPPPENLATDPGLFKRGNSLASEATTVAAQGAKLAIPVQQLLLSAELVREFAMCIVSELDGDSATPQAISISRFPRILPHVMRGPISCLPFRDSSQTRQIAQGCGFFKNSLHVVDFYISSSVDKVFELLNARFHLRIPSLRLLCRVHILSSCRPYQNW